MVRMSVNAAPPAGQWLPVDTSVQNPKLIAETRTPSELSAQGIVNDASGLNPTRMAKIVRPESENEIARALAYARANNLTVSVSGERHSMGGQALQPNALLLDMTGFTGVRYNPSTQTVSARAGTTWGELQKYLDGLGRAVAVKQASSIFTVGGSLSVNCHGEDIRFGPLINTVKSLRIMTADGKILNASRAENSELFRHAVGGYGLFGVILDAEFSTLPNEMYHNEIKTLPLARFLEYYKKEIAGNPDARLMQAQLSISPHSFLDEVLLDTWTKAETPAAGIPPFRPADASTFRLWAAKIPFDLAMHCSAGKRLLWGMETRVLPHFVPELISRNQAMNPPFEFLRGSSQSHTQILHEYFVPRDQLVNFVNRFKQVCGQHHPNILHVAIRDVPKDTDSALPYAPKDSFAIVLYLDEKTAPEAKARMDLFTLSAANAALASGGTFYLPYQLPFTSGQMRQAYPGLDAFFSVKRKYDPGKLFTNSLYERYGGSPA